MSPKIKRNTKHIFYYLPYPKFIISFFKNGKFYYKCINCPNVYPTKYRFLRYFRTTKCLSKNKRIYFCNKLNEIKKMETKINFDIDHSDLVICDKEFLLKILETIEFYFNKNENEENNCIENNDNNSSYNKELIIIDNMRLSRKDGLIGIGHFSDVYGGHSNNDDSVFAIKKFKKKYKYFSKRISKSKTFKGDKRCSYINRF